MTLSPLQVSFGSHCHIPSLHSPMIMLEMLNNMYEQMIAC